MQDEIEEDERPAPGQSLAELYGIADEAEPTAALEPAAPEAIAAEVPAEIAGDAPTSAEGGKFARMVAQLEAAGLDSDDAIETLMAQQAGQQQIEAELGALWEDLQGRIDAGETTPEIAQMLYDAKQQALEAQVQLQGQSAQMERQKALQSAEALSKIDPALGQFAQQAGFTPEQSQALAQALEPLLGKAKQSAVSQYVADKGAAGGGGATAPIPQGAATSPVPTDIDVDSMSFTDLFKMQGAIK